MDGSAPYTYTSIPPGPTPGAFSCDRSNLNLQKYVDLSQIVTGGSRSNINPVFHPVGLVDLVVPVHTHTQK